MGVSAALGAPGPGGARLSPIAFADIPGWAADDHAAAFAAFRRTCPLVLDSDAAVRAALPPPPELAQACRAALALPAATAAAARAFFETWFEPRRIDPPAGQGFLTGYYEPEVSGSIETRPGFSAPILARPADLVTLPPGPAPAPLDPALAAARRIAGGLESFPDRAAIEDGALAGQGLELVYLPDTVETFLIHVQGSARVRLPDGRALRLGYAGRNGHPYTSIGRILVEEGHVAPGEMSLERLKAWLRAHPDEARAIMRRNRSYIFFRLDDALEDGDGPRGGAGVPLTPGRSLAVDRNLWSYGLPFFLSGRLPEHAGGEEPLARLMIAQDTGSAILGPARGDFFHGSGAEAGRLAGLTRHATDFIVFWPRAEPRP